jgi:hypothetical protein
VAKTAREALALWEARVQEDTPDMLHDLMTPAAAETFSRCWEAACSCGHAKRRLLAALDEQFGQQADTLPWGVDDEEVSRRLRQCRLEIDPATQSAETVAVIDRANGKVLLEAVRTDRGWKLIPVALNQLADPAALKKHVAGVRAVAAAYDDVAKRVRAGEFSSREAAKAALAAYRAADHNK